MKKTLKILIAVLIAMASVISLASCDLFGAEAPETLGATEAPQSDESTTGNEIPAEGLWKDAIYRVNKTLGSGAKTVQVEVKVSGKSVTLTLKTDKATLGDALVEHSLVEGDQGAYGLYVKKVNGITADYDVDKSYWGFYKNGQYMMTGIDLTSISDGEHYELVREG